MSADQGPAPAAGTSGAGRPGWVAAIEGFYGAPYSHEARLGLLRWLPSVGVTDYAYGPKDDAYQRADWRAPYPAAQEAQLRATAAVADAAGVRLTLAVSPGLDWRGPADHAALVAKVRQLVDLGVRSVGVYFDDVPPGGADLGRSHGQGVAAAVAGLPDGVAVMTCGTDYAFDRVTGYLRAFAAAVPGHVPLAWTGPDITSPVVPATLARDLGAALGHPLLLCDNWPVNDLGMSGQLHLGPAPAREPALRDAVAGVGFNLMRYPLASRVALTLGVRHWLDPYADREAAWADVVSAVPGLLPLARACRSWLDAPGPDPWLLGLLDDAMAGGTALLEHLEAGVGDGLAPEWLAELRPWVESAQAEGRVMAWVLRAARGEVGDGVDLGADWLALHRREAQTYGTRLALYGRSHRTAGELLVPHPDAVVRGDNLTDLVVRRVLEGFAAQ